MRAILARLLIVAAAVVLAFAHRPTNANGAGDSMRAREVGSRSAVPGETPRLRSTLVGIVVPGGIQAGDRVSATLVTNPRDYEGIPGLVVTSANVTLPHDRNGHPLLTNVVVRPASEAAQPASKAVTFTVPRGERVRFTLATAESASALGELDVPVSDRSIATASRSSEFTTLPVMAGGVAAVIHGPFLGDASRTRVEINGVVARVLTESPRETFFEPRSIHDGLNRVVVREGRRRASFGVFAPKLELVANKRTLGKDETTDFSVRISALNGMPDTDWKASIPSKSAERSVETRLPAASNGASGGDLLLTIRNDSPDVVTMAGAGGDTISVHVGRADLARGRYEYKGSLTAQRAGEFALEASVLPLLAEVVGDENDDQLEEEDTGDHSLTVSDATPTPLPIPHARATESKVCPQRGDGCAVLILELIQIDESPDEGEIKERKTEREGLEKLAAELNKVCSVDKVFADFKKVEGVHVGVARRETIDGRTNRPIMHVQLDSDSDAVKAAERHNLEEWKKIRNAIETHRKRVRDLQEIAIEIVSAHGSRGAQGDEKKNTASTCGNWGPGVEKGYYTPQEKSLTAPNGSPTDYEEPLFALWRDEFHEGNYAAAKGNVCDWNVYDFSCYSGQTPMAIDELENRGSSATCAQPSIVNCGMHAGWETDFARGTSPCAVTAHGHEVADDIRALTGTAKDVSSVAELTRRLRASARKTNEINETLKGTGIGSRESSYSDWGYHDDPIPVPPPLHPHSGY